MLVVIGGSNSRLAEEFIRSMKGDSLESGAILGFDVQENPKIRQANYDYLSASVLDKQSLSSVSKRLQELMCLSDKNRDLAVINCFVAPEYQGYKNEMSNPPENAQASLVAWTKYPSEDFINQLNLNIVGIHNILTTISSEILESRSCSIVNITSQFGIKAPKQNMFDGLPNFVFKAPAYSVSKAGVINYTQYLSNLFAGTHIRVNAIAYGPFPNGQRKEFVENYVSHSNLGRMMQMCETVGPIKFLISQEASFMTGATLVVDAGWTIN